MKDWEWKDILVGLFLIAVVFVAPAFMVMEGEGIKNAFNHEGLPRIDISLSEVSLEDVKSGSKENKYLVDNLKLTDESGVSEFFDVELKGRGNATWQQEKKPYQIKLSKKADLLGLGERKKWILLANAVDNTNLRTDTAFYIEKMLDSEFAYDGAFVDLYVDGDFEGLYYLTRGIEIGKDAVDLKDPMGILVELDNIYARLETQYFVTGNGEHLTIKDVKVKDNKVAAMEDFLKDFNELEEAVRKKEYSEIVKLIDVESFAKYYLLEEFISNPDAYLTSQYFYKDGASDKIHAGPAWDFDIAMSLNRHDSPNANYTESIILSKDLDFNNQYSTNSRLFVRLLALPEFRSEVNRIFIEQMSGRKQELLDYILGRVEQIRRSALVDAKKWDKNDFEQKVEVLLDWVSARYDFFESQYGLGLQNK